MNLLKNKVLFILTFFFLQIAYATQYQCNEVLNWPAYDIPESWFSQLSLEDEMHFSDLPTNVLEVLSEYSAGVFSIRDFYKHIEKIQPYFKLGLDHYRQVSYSILQTTSISKDAYRELGVSGEDPDHTNKILSRMINSNKPIVFFIPRYVLTHQQRNATANELIWLLRTPKQNLKNVYFVFGAYDIFTQEGAHYFIQNFPNTESRMGAMSYIFQSFKK